MIKAATNFSFIEPMKAMKVNELPAGDWLYEIKFDGYRALAFKAGDEVRLISRNRKSFNDDYPVLIDSLKSLKTKGFTIHGDLWLHVYRGHRRHCVPVAARNLRSSA